MNNIVIDVPFFARHDFYLTNPPRFAAAVSQMADQPAPIHDDLKFAGNTTGLDKR